MNPIDIMVMSMCILITMMIKTYRMEDRHLAPFDPGFFTFPAGEWTLDDATIHDGDHIVVEVRGTDVVDLMKARLVAQVVSTRQGKATLLLPYLPAARSDHDDVMGVEAYASMVRDVFDEIITIDPHSEVAQLAYGATVVDHTALVLEALRHDEDFSGGLVGVIAADKSGSLHAQHVAEALGVPIFQALKHRDPATGKLSGFTCESLPEEGNLLIVDDICDGGGTFLGLADATGIRSDRMGLWVTHGIFSGNALDRLAFTFAWLATTDSFRYLNAGERRFCTQVPVFDTLVSAL